MHSFVSLHCSYLEQQPKRSPPKSANIVIYTALIGSTISNTSATDEMGSLIHISLFSLTVAGTIPCELI